MLERFRLFCEKISSGFRSRSAKKLVANLDQEIPCLRALYGMGSYFRGTPFRDLDFVAVVSCERDELVEVGRLVRSSLAAFGSKVGVPIDVSVFTVREFQRRPHRDMPTLVLLHGMDCRLPAASGRLD